MRHLLSCAIFLMLLTQHAHAQQAPLIDVRNAVAEFISDDEIPNFTIRGMYVLGKVDTMKAVIKTSTVRALGSEYVRYKPVLDKIAWHALDSSRAEVVVSMHLEGKVLPLPQDSVRGSVRLTVSAAAWNGTDWLGTTSEALTVPIANVTVPRPIIATQGMKVVRSVSSSGATEFVIAGVRLVRPAPDSVDGMPDVREIEFGEVDCIYEKKSLRTEDVEKDGKRNVVVEYSTAPDGVIGIRGRVEGLPLSSVAAREPLTFVVLIRGRLRHGHISGPVRSKSLTVTVPPSPTR